MDLKDFSTKKANEGAELTLLHPVTGELLDAKIKLLGQDSEVYVRESNKIVDRRIKTLRNRNAKKLTAAETNEENKQLYAAVTVGWSGFKNHGKEIEFSRQNVLDVYAKEPWILEQVEDFVEDRANFL